jgi:[acyl-carrier-protein] S-malonyltransferase
MTKTAFVAFVFPGQGSQSVGMLAALADNPAVVATLAEANAALGFDLSGLIADGPADELNLTVNTQPAMLTAAIAIYRAYLAAGGKPPDIVAGHSLGEYSALVAAGVLSFADAVKAVRFRAEAMQAAVPPGVGAMAAILGLDAAVVVSTCAEAAATHGAVEAVNFNDPKQTVIAGTKAGVDKACELLKAKGAKRALLLPVSAPFHSSLMAPAALRLRDYLATVPFAVPQIPLVNNIDVAQPTDAAAIRGALYRQAFGPVRWVETVQALSGLGVTRVVECGPGKVLAGLVKRVDSAMDVTPMFDAASLEAVLTWKATEELSV